jgi:hypothetical protein
MLRITIRIANAYCEKICKPLSVKFTSERSTIEIRVLTDSLFHIFFTDVNTLIVPRVIAPFTSPVSSTLVSNLADAPSAMSDAILR